LLRRRLGVFEFADDPACIFRLSDAVYRGDRLVLPDGEELSDGDRIGELHLSTERVPVLEPAMSGLGWAHRMRASIGHSLDLLGCYLSEPGAAGIRAIRANLAQATPGEAWQIVRIMQHFGFTPGTEPKSESLGKKLHRFGENILVSMLVAAHNPRALRWDTLRRTRIPVFISSARLRQRCREASKGAGE
jgi:hypothetical protein